MEKKKAALEKNPTANVSKSNLLHGAHMGANGKLKNYLIGSHANKKS